MSIKKNPKQIKKAYEDYFNSLSNAELREAIETARNKLKILLTIAKGKTLEFN